MKIEVTSNFKNDFENWKKQDKNITNRIIKLIESIGKTPFEGIGKPEPLKYELSGCWSRRINKEHRIIYRVVKDKIQLLTCKYHY